MLYKIKNYTQNISIKIKNYLGKLICFTINKVKNIKFGYNYDEIKYNK